MGLGAGMQLGWGCSGGAVKRSLLPPPPPMLEETTTPQFRELRPFPGAMGAGAGPQPETDLGARQRF